ncbi:hypothetical protein EJ110_NYTH21261 [Nymphaea thermarum]|nr:hypothetical protein EJ110_NYTH21261 [Nymphaea thermarum]
MAAQPLRTAKGGPGQVFEASQHELGDAGRRARHAEEAWADTPSKLEFYLFTNIITMKCGNLKIPGDDVESENHAPCSSHYLTAHQRMPITGLNTSPSSVSSNSARLREPHGYEEVSSSPAFPSWKANNGGKRKEVVLPVTVRDVPMRKLLPNLDREDGLDTIREVPVSEEIFNPMDGSTKSNSWSNVKTWMKCSQVSSVRPAALLPDAGGSGNSELPLLLNVVGAPLIPLPVQNDT